MPIPSKADGNVPFLGSGRKRYNVLSPRQSTWVFHEMAGGSALNGSYAKTGSLTKDEIDPVVTPGRASWTALTEGGLFSFVGNYRRSLICEAVDNAGTATLTLVNAAGTLLRNMPTSFPFTIAAGEFIKATGGSAGAKVGFLLRIDEKTIL